MKNIIEKSYPLGRNDGSHSIKIGDGKLYSFGFELLINLANALGVWLVSKSIGPRANEAEYFFLNDGRWFVLWSDGFNEFLNKIPTAGEHVKAFATIFDACFQNNESVHDDCVIFASSLIEPAFDSFDSVSGAVFGFIDNIANFHVQSPIFTRQTSICGLFYKKLMKMDKK